MSSTRHIGEYERKIILVTGGAGGIGTNLCWKLAELNAENVIILDDLSSAYGWNVPKATNITFVKGSVLDDDMLKRVFVLAGIFAVFIGILLYSMSSIFQEGTDRSSKGG